MNPSTAVQSLLLLFVWIGCRHCGLTVAAVPTFHRTMRLQRNKYRHVKMVFGFALIIAARRGNILVVASDGDSDIPFSAADGLGRTHMGSFCPDPGSSTSTQACICPSPGSRPDT